MTTQQTPPYIWAQEGKVEIWWVRWVFWKPFVDAINHMPGQITYANMLGHPLFVHPLSPSLQPKKKKEKVNGCPLEMIGETCDLCPSSVWINCVAHARLATIWGVACGRWAASSGWWTVGVSHGPHNKWLYVLVHRWRRRRRTSAVRNRTVPVCGAPFPVLHPTLVLAKSFGILTADKEALYV